MMMTVPIMIMMVPNDDGGASDDYDGADDDDDDDVYKTTASEQQFYSLQTSSFQRNCRRISRIRFWPVNSDVLISRPKSFFGYMKRLPVDWLIAILIQLSVSS